MKTDVRVAKPFVKWVGGKGRLVPQLAALFPSEWNNYFEPFLGGGAVFFATHHKNKAYINDINDNLINAYVHLRDDVELIIAKLKNLEKKYLALSEEERKLFYYEKRSAYNKAKINSLSKTVYLIFLNRTCFNGLYRENRKGEFNVPIGRNKNPTICNEENLRAISNELKNTEITNTSYVDAVSAAKSGDFIYFDPPYHPLNETSSFTDYHEDGFSKNDQIRLKELVDELTARGCYVMMSNSDSEFIRELYKEYRQERVYAARAINSVAAKRGKITELAVLNYDEKSLLLSR